MFVLLFDVFNYLLLRKTDVLKTCQENKFLRKKIWINALALKSKKVQGIFRENLYFGIVIFSCLSSTKRVSVFFSSDLFRDRRFLPGFLRKWCWFQGHNEHFFKYLGETLKFQKTEKQFCRWKSTDKNNINIFLSLENPCTFLLAKEKTWKCIFNTNSKLFQNRTEEQILEFKATVNCLFNDIWCYLVIVSIHWNIGIFQQTVLRSLLYP